MTNEINKSKNIAIIDDDELIRNLISNYASTLGFENVDAFNAAEDMWASLESGKHYDLVVLDWKLPGLNGVGLFNRLRAHPDYNMLPVLVISGFLNKEDFALLEEFPCTELLEKPFTKSLIENKVGFLAKESKWYEEKSEFISDLLVSFRSDGPGVVKAFKKVFAESPNPMPLVILAAKILRQHDFFEEAKSILETVLKKHPNSVVAIGELGKVLFQMGELEQSKKILRLANRLSPENLKRLCLLGEIDLNLQQPEEARKYFESALNIDPEDKTAAAGVTLSDNIEFHLVNHTKHSIPQNFASLLNIIAITKVKSGEFQEGIEQYKAALSFLTADLVVARVAFNVGLGFLRWSRPAEALPWFVKSSNAGNGNFAKSSYYIEQLNKRGVVAAEEQAVAAAVSVSDADIQSVVSSVEGEQHEIDENEEEAMQIDSVIQAEDDNFSIAEADSFFDSIEGMGMDDLVALDDEELSMDFDDEDEAKAS